jgi:hypothetical protein
VIETAPIENWQIVENIPDVYATGTTSVLTDLQTFYEKKWLVEGKVISYVAMMAST